MNQTIPRLLLTLGILIIAPLALTACTTPPEEDNAPVITDTPPPATPLVNEQIPVIPDPEAEIWRPGYWVLSGPNFAWVPGKLIPRPSPTAVWIAARWDHHTFGWSFQQGHWQ